MLPVIYSCLVVYNRILCIYVIKNIDVLVPLVIVWAVVNTVAWVYGSTQALPWSTVILLFFVWAVRKCFENYKTFNST